jgi:hypothetical protein
LREATKRKKQSLEVQRGEVTFQQLLCAEHVREAGAQKNHTGVWGFCSVFMHSTFPNGVILLLSDG